MGTAKKSEQFKSCFIDVETMLRSREPRKKGKGDNLDPGDWAALQIKRFISTANPTLRFMGESWTLQSSLRDSQVRKWIAGNTEVRAYEPLVFVLAQIGVQAGLSIESGEFRAALAKLWNACDPGTEIVFSKFLREACNADEGIEGGAKWSAMVALAGRNFMQPALLEKVVERYEGYWILYRLQSMTNQIVRYLLLLNAESGASDLMTATLWAQGSVAEYDAQGIVIPNADHLSVPLFHPWDRARTSSVSMLQLHRLDPPNHRYSSGLFVGSSHTWKHALVARHVVARKLYLKDEAQLNRWKKASNSDGIKGRGASKTLTAKQTGRESAQYELLPFDDAKQWLETSGLDFLPDIAGGQMSNLVELLRSMQEENVEPIYSNPGIAAHHAVKCVEASMQKRK